MSVQPPKTGRRTTPGAAYSLIEMLVVIAVIAILASMIFPVSNAVTRNRMRTKTMAELQEVQTAIEAYKAKTGHYPPDNANNHLVNQLYYELVGATYAPKPGGFDTTMFATTDGGTLATNKFITAMASQNSWGVTSTNPPGGLVNFVPAVDKEEGTTAYNFIKGFGPVEFQTDPTTGLKFLVASTPWPAQLAAGFPPFSGFVNGYCAWRYSSTSPVNNTGSFDLWVDVLIGGKTNRICNWSRDPFYVSTPDE